MSLDRGVLVALALMGAACGPALPGASGAASEPIQVFAAASLSDAFTEIGASFEKAHPGARVRLSFGGSPTLATQLVQGAPADVFASADEANMRKVVDAGLVAAQPRLFAANRLEIVVPAGNPRQIHSLADLARPDLVVVLCAPAVPCGSYGQQALAKAGVTVRARSLEQDVKGVVTKVALKEADAGIVYVTDVLAAAPRVAGIAIPEALNVPASYPLAPLRGGANEAGGRMFVQYVLGPDAGAVLARYGFTRP